MTVRQIIASVGQFPQDNAVLARALEIATIHRAALTIVHVIDLPGCDTTPIDRDTLAEQAALAVRDGIKAMLTDAGVDESRIDIRIETGSPALRLIELCQDLSPDLIVMRAHERASIAEKLLGSTTDRVIAAGGVPVLVVKRPVARPYSRVVFATNGVDDAFGALSFVTALLPAADLHLVQAVQIAPQLKEAMLRAGSGQAALTAYRHGLTRIYREHLRELAAKATGRVTTRVLQGDPVVVLVRATRRPNVDLIAVGPGRTSLIRRAFIGSVTRRLLREAACDVLVCRPAQTG